MSALIETPADMHRIAAQLRSCATGLRDHAARLAAGAESTRWYSPAAADFKGQVHAVARQMFTAAERLDNAAHTLDQHARRVHDVVTAPARAVSALGHLAGL